jgi:hypothetical protein
MPPQQPYGLLHLIEEIDDFGAHQVILAVDPFAAQ